MANPAPYDGGVLREGASAPLERTTMAGTKRFSLLDAVLNMICVVFVAEAAAPAAAIGNSQYFWWLMLIITFLLPYGMIVSELGSTYPDDEGGVYDWVKRAFDKRVAGLVADRKSVV